MSILLQACERAGKDIQYYALDLSKPELERTLAAVEGVYSHIECRGLLGTYDDGLAWLKQIDNIKKPKCILWMGSSIGNLDRTEAATFLKGFSEVLGEQDSMLIGVDACQDKDKVYNAYNDKRGKTHEFILNGLSHASRLAGAEIFVKDDWKVIGEYDEEAGRHQAFLTPVKNVMVEETPIRAGERVRIEESYKYSPLQTKNLWQAAGLFPHARFGDTSNQYRESNDLCCATYCTLPVAPSQFIHFFSRPVLRIEDTLHSTCYQTNHSLGTVSSGCITSFQTSTTIFCIFWETERSR